MKRLVLLCVCAIMCATSCGQVQTEPTPSEQIGTDEPTTEVTEQTTPEPSTEAITPAPTEATTAAPATQATESPATEATADDSWRQFLADYEAWADDYIALLEKYKANPMDLSILSDYTSMMSKLTEWSEKADDIQGDLGAEDLAEYLETLSRITGKLAKAAY